ncbi:MAG TPA: ABC transporter substrate-binding protein [Phycisphaerae bacterium]|nr:ABC transporter substrate-binding protein [Phycisphaerae bacterium]
MAKTRVLLISGWLLFLAAAAIAADTAPASKPADSIVEKKLIIGFVQVGYESDWRNAMTKSIVDEAEKRGYELKVINANGKADLQVAGFKTLVEQRVDAILLAPMITSGWEATLKDAKDTHVPVILLDRAVDVPEDLYVTLISSDFALEGSKAGSWLVEKTGGKASVFILSGVEGSKVTSERQAGFDAGIKGKTGMKVVGAKSGGFTRAGGHEVMTAALRSGIGPEITAVFAHNDDMALGAIAAIKEAGKKPGVDITVVSIDATKAAMEATAKGELNCTVECNPLMGPQVFDVVDGTVPRHVKKYIPTREAVYEQGSAQEALSTRKY